ncbi:MAG: D-2-hydroxyacid dehydrogenase [Pseudomonadota bacterium]
MPAPILLLTAQAEIVRDRIAPRLPEERFLCVTGPDDVEAALASEPEIAFLIRGRGLPGEAYDRAARLPSLRWLHSAGSGYEYLPRWDPEKLVVTNGVGILAAFLADTAMGAILSLNRGFPVYAERQRMRRWEGRPFRALAGQRLLVVGAGAIGQVLAERARAFGMTTIGLSREGAPRAPFDEMHPLGALDDLLGEADVVSCHLRLTPQTTDMFDARRFARMKPGALFLNSARGRHVDEAALLAALASGHLGGAWLDVFRTEPLPAESPLWDAPNLMITPPASAPHCRRKSPRSARPSPPPCPRRAG